MVKIQLDLTEEEDEFVSIYKIKNKLDTKADAIKQIIKEELKK